MLHEVNKTYKSTYTSVSQITNNQTLDSFKGSAGFRVQFGEVEKKPRKQKQLKPEEKEKMKKPKSETYTLNKTKVRQKINALSNTAIGKKQLFFYTVTFPKQTNDKLAYKILNISLTRLRKEKRIKNYLWVAERQKVGTIHFHILTTEFIKVLIFNEIVKASIRTEIKRGNIAYCQQAIEKYSGVDIAKNRKTRKVTNFAKGSKSKSLQKYITKYISKNDTKFGTLIWHCSRSVSALFTSQVIEYEEFTDFLPYMKLNFCYTIKLPNCTVDTWVFDKEPPPKMFNNLTALNNLILESHFR